MEKTPNIARRTVRADHGSDETIPTPEQIKAARKASLLSQHEAAGLVHLGAMNRWSEYERGVCKMDPARWELFLLLTGQHPRFHLTPNAATNISQKE